MPFNPISTTNPTTLGFGSMANARVPTAFWGSLGIPRKTNDTWTNLVVDGGDNPVGTFPYIYKADNNGLNIGYNPNKQDSPTNASQDYVRDYGFYSVEGLNKREVINLGVFGCEYKWFNTASSGNYLSTCFVKGQSFTTVKYNNLIPVFKPDGSFTKINSSTTLTNGQTFTGTTFRLETNNGKIYKLYIPVSVTLTLNTSDWKLSMSTTLTNIVKFAYIGKTDEPVASLNEREAIYDVYGANQTYVTGGNIDATTFNGDSANFVITWTKQGTDNILQFAFPHTQDIIQSPNYKALTLNTIKGDMKAIEGNSWTMVEPLATYDFNYNAFHSPDIQAIKDALATEYQFQPNSDSDTYFGFKELMKLSQLGTIADQLGETAKRETICDSLVTKINAWLNTTNANKMKYDTSWGGFSGEQGLADSGASFGSGTYSDHHFHYGYFINACAVLAKLRPAWATATVQDKVNLWIRDIFNPSTGDTYFPQYRCKDWFCGHAWANGTSSQGGVNNQESTSEDINAWYGVYLWGKTTNNASTRDLGRLALAQSIRSARKYWLMPASSSIYPAQFKNRKVVGIVEGTKASYGTFFGGNEEFIHGIQMLPFTNPTKQYYSNVWNGSEHWEYIRANILERSYPVAPVNGSISGGNGYGGTPIGYYGTNLLLQDNCTTTNQTGTGTGLKVKVLSNPTTNQVVAIEVIGQYSSAGTGYKQGDIVRPNTASGSGCTFQVSVDVDTGWKSMFYMYRALTDANDSWAKVQTLTGYDGGNSKTNSLAWVSQFRSAPVTNPTPTPTPTPTPVPPTGTVEYTVSSGLIYKNGAQIKIRGINWSGGEGIALFPFCWNNSYQAMVQLAKSAGVNAFRLPVTKETFLLAERTGKDGNGNFTINQSYTDNQTVTNIQPLLAWDKLTDYLSSQGIYFIFDWHVCMKGQLPGSNEFGIWYGRNGVGESDWIDYLVTLANRYKNNPYFLGLDLCNEPEKAKWDGSNDANNFRRAAEVCGQRILQANPNILIWVEGVANNQAGIGNGIIGQPEVPANWGSDLRAFGTYPIRPEFIPKNKLVLSPHPYGPNVLGENGYSGLFKQGAFPDNMVPIWMGQFGYLIEQGYTFSMGEYGGLLIDKPLADGGTSTPNNERDKTFQYKLANWFNSKGNNNHFYWMQNNEGSDTAGLFKSDMQTFNPTVKDFLGYQFGLAGTYTTGTGTVTTPPPTTGGNTNTTPNLILFSSIGVETLTNKIAIRYR